MFSVHEDLYELPSRRVGKVCPLSEVEGHTVSQKSPVHPVCKEDPSLMLRHSEDLCLRIKFQGIWLLRVVPGAVSAASHACRALVVHCPVRVVNSHIRAFQPILPLAWNGLASGGLDEDQRKTGILYCQGEGVFDPVLDSVGHRLGEVVDCHSAYLLDAVHIYLCSAGVESGDKVRACDLRRGEDCIAG